MKYREQHLEILRKNISTHVPTIQRLKEELSHLHKEKEMLAQEMSNLRKKNESQAQEIAHLRTKLANLGPSNRNFPSSIERGERNIGGKADYAAERTAAENRTIGQTAENSNLWKGRPTAYRSQTLPQTRKFFSYRDASLHETVGTAPRKNGVGIDMTGGQLGAAGSKGLKRSWRATDSTFAPGLNRNVGYNSQATKLTGLSKFAGNRGDQESRRGGEFSKVGYDRHQSILGTRDWPRRVSTVPKPSATPDRFGKMRKRRKLEVTPLGTRTK